LRGKRLGVLGLAFKGGTDDIRESPALEIMQMLLDAGATICAHDPAANERAKLEMPAHANLQYTDDPYAAADNADALLILTDWAEFSRLDLERLRYTLRYPIIIDGRNLFDPWTMQELGFTYLSVGRPSQHTSVESASTKRWP
jgi:UDPglucose 6-dehydrogenase